ncbi:MAG: ribosome silencing factor [Bacteroidota bacterium]
MRELPSNTPDVVLAAIKGIQEVKGKDITCLDLRKIHNRVTDFFIICHGDSSTQVNAIADSVEEFTWKLAKEDARHKEGRNNAEWVLLDYFDVVVHIFHRDKREHFNLEYLWADAPVYEIEETEAI